MERILERVRTADTIFIPKSEREIVGAVEWLQQEVNVDVPEFGEDQLVAWSDGQQFAKLRSSCILPVVEQVENTVGFAGSTKFKNYQFGLPGWSSILRIAPIGPPKCRLSMACLSGREDEIRNALTDGEPLMVATEFTNIATEFARQKSYNLSFLQPAPAGSIEAFPVLGLSDVVIDLVDTGKTMVAQDLVQLETVQKDFPGLIWRSDFLPPANENAPPSFDAPGLIASMMTIRQRARNVAAGKEPQTYTERLLASLNEMVKKYSSESGEFLKAVLTEDREAKINEAADLIYAAEALLASEDITLAEVLDELVRRNKPKA